MSFGSIIIDRPLNTLTCSRLAALRKSLSVTGIGRLAMASFTVSSIVVPKRKRAVQRTTR